MTFTVKDLQQICTPSEYKSISSTLGSHIPSKLKQIWDEEGKLRFINEYDIDMAIEYFSPPHKVERHTAAREKYRKYIQEIKRRKINES